MKSPLIICIFALSFGILYTSHAKETVKQHVYIDSIKIDPVCTMKVKYPAKHISTYQKNDYWFCAKGCKTKFDKNPAQYLKK